MRTWLRNILLTSCLVTMPTARSAAGSTTPTHPIFSLTREATTLDSLSSGMAVTHFAAGIMKLATDGMCSFARVEVLFGVRAGRAVCSAAAAASRRDEGYERREGVADVSPDILRDRDADSADLSLGPSHVRHTIATVFSYCTRHARTSRDALGTLKTNFHNANRVLAAARRLPPTHFHGATVSRRRRRAVVFATLLG